MKRFWKLVFVAILTRVVILGVVLSLLHWWNFWAVLSVFGIALTSVAIRFGGEYWVMSREAGKFRVELEFFARVRYELGWSLLYIQTNHDEIEKELEKRK